VRRQRDFLEGKTVAAMLAEALATVPNPTRDPDIDQACPILSMVEDTRCPARWSARKPHAMRRKTGCSMTRRTHCPLSRTC